MTTIKYKFVDGHTEEIEVTEEFALQYELFEAEQRRYEEREKKRRRHNRSFERMVETGYDFQDYSALDPLEILLEQEREEAVGNIIKLSDFLTDRQRQVLGMYYEVGYTKAEIARLLSISKPTVKQHIRESVKKILKNFS